MPLFEIDESLNRSEEIADFFLYLLEEDRISVPKLSIPQLLTAKTRPGLDADTLASSIISRFSEIGIPTGPLVGGSPNVMELLVKIMCEEFIEHLRNQMRVDIAVDTGVQVIANGGNAGGPVVAVGQSIAPHTGIGVAR